MSVQSGVDKNHIIIMRVIHGLELGWAAYCDSFVGGIMKPLLSALLTVSVLVGAAGVALGDAKQQEDAFTNYMLYCKPLGGGRKAVWMNTDQGTFALNGQAISWAQGAALQGNDGKPWKLGRDHIEPLRLSHLIEEGLKKCR